MDALEPGPAQGFGQGLAFQAAPIVADGLAVVSGRFGQEVGEGVFRSVAAGGGVEHELLAGAGEGDIQKAQAFAEVFGKQLPLVFFAQLGFGQQ